MSDFSRNIHNPIPQYGGTRDSDNCPRCHHTREGGFSYGTVDTPPIAIQYEDEQIGLKRKWLALRCHCPKCHYLWDLVITDELIKQR